MNDHAQQLETAFRFGFTSGIAAAATRLTLAPEQLAAMERWHIRLQRWRDAPEKSHGARWPDIDDKEPHGGQTSAA
jgi:hypothetical protein